jgi:hypothetical protein
VFGEKLKGERVLLDEKGFCKERFALRGDKDKPLKGSKCHIKLLSLS